MVDEASISFLIFANVLTVQHTEHFRIEAPAVVTIGTFDGVHLGHQKILRHLASVKEKTGLQTVVLTFDPHPRRVLFPEQKDLRLLTTVDEKLELMARHGVDVAVVRYDTDGAVALVFEVLFVANGVGVVVVVWLVEDLVLGIG